MPEAEKTIERVLDVGKWKLGVEAGHDVLGVYLKGMRNRPFPLMSVNREQFAERTTRKLNGTFDNEAVLRGVPVCYWHDGQSIHLWPAAAHQWTLRIDLAKRVKV